MRGSGPHTEEIAASWMMGNNFMGYTAWILGTILGTALGGLLPNPESFGLDFCPSRHVYRNLLLSLQSCCDGVKIKKLF